MSSIRYRPLFDDDSTRLYRREPGLAQGYEKWCPTCDKKGTYVTPNNVVETCDCELQVALFKHYAAAGIGTTYMRLDWGDYQGSEGILTGLAKYETNRAEFVRRGMGIYLSGDVGTGKTMLANLVLKDMIKTGYSCFATTFAQTIDAYTSTWGDRDEKAWFQRKFLGSQMLLLDDVGKELRNTKLALAESTFDSILRQRVTNGRPTFITTNLDASDLAEGYGAGILSLIREQSLEEVVTGEDYRPKANTLRVDEVLKGFTRAII